MSPQNLPTAQIVEQEGPHDALLLQNYSQFPEENRGFATSMRPQNVVFVAKLSGTDDSTHLAHQTPDVQDPLTSLLARVQNGGLSSK